jgi:hypothetical protein
MNREKMTIERLVKLRTNFLNKWAVPNALIINKKDYRDIAKELKAAMNWDKPRKGKIYFFGARVIRSKDIHEPIFCDLNF